MRLAVHGLELNESRLSECSYVLFGVLARVFRQDFSIFLPMVLPRLIKSCQTTEKDWNELLDKVPDNVVEELSEFDDEDHQNGFSMAAAHEKESSLDALGELFEATQSAFLPYVQETIQIVLAQFGHYHEGVRTSAVQCALKFYTTLYEMSNPGEWEAGLPLKPQLSEEVADMAKLVMNAVLNLLEDEEDR